jgi:hypothetical protein
MDGDDLWQMSEINDLTRGAYILIVTYILPAKLIVWRLIP